MKVLRIIGLLILLFFVLQEFANAYKQIGWDVIFIIIPFAFIVAGVIYWRRRVKQHKNKL
ncbi:hypothetical protein DQQ10_10785 [Pseudochryseolinea flava]|uniref:Uncharacterized protein n=1 Tax=Pseudochryseolinea flava TaxID=2059302 RepID=A0A364Y3J5_9BACT|nr:hypothetical protein DQQ10_10785 [Pseudochryseolinea flava]